MRKIHDIFNSAAMLSASVVFVKILGAVYKVPISYMIGEVGLGYFNIAYSIFAFFFLLMSGGLGRALTVTVSRLSKTDKSQGYALYKRIRFILLIISIFFSLLIFFCAEYLAILFGSPGSSQCIRAIAPGVLFVGVGCVSRGYLNAHLRLGAIAVSQVLEALIKLACGIVFGRIGMSMGLDASYVSALIISGVTVGAAASALIQRIACEILSSGYNLRQNGFCLDVIVREFVADLIPLTLSSLAASLSGLVDTFTILKSLGNTGCSGDEAVRLYGNYSTLALPLVSLVASVISPLCLEMLPRIAKLGNREDVSGHRTVLNRYVSVTLVFTLPIAISFMMYSFEIIDLLYPSNQAARASDLLCILGPTVVFQPIYNLILAYFEGVKRAGISTAFSFSYLVIKAFMNGILLRNPALSINGAAVSTTLTYLCLICIMFIIIGKDRECNAGKTNVISLCITAVLGFVPPYFLIYLNNLVNNSLLSALVAGGIGAFAYLGLLASNRDIGPTLFAKYTKKQKICYEERRN